MAIAKPFNLNKWVEEHREHLKPPVGNKNLYKDAEDYIVMIVAGPNARKDYHYNETEELFYQLEGHIEVHIQEDGEKKTMRLGPGDMYLHPAGVPHSPVRHENSIGLVVERKRKKLNVDDGLLWYFMAVKKNVLVTTAELLCLLMNDLLQLNKLHKFFSPILFTYFCENNLKQ